MGENMGLKLCLSRVIGEMVALSAAVAALVLIAAVPTSSLAGSISGQPADTLDVVGAPASVLPQASGAAAENSWLSGLHVSGYLSQQFGMW